MNDETERSDDAESVDPVARYYADKKKRYLEDARRAAENMTTGTPHDWEDAKGYAQAASGDETPDDETPSSG